MTATHRASAPPETPFSRAVDALAIIAEQYGLPGPSGALQAAGPAWRDEALAQLAEAVSALLVEVKPAAGKRY